MGFNPDQPRDELGRFAPGEGVTVMAGPDKGMRGVVVRHVANNIKPHIKLTEIETGDGRLVMQRTAHLQRDTPSTPAEAKARIRELQNRIKQTQAETKAIDRQLGAEDRARDRGDSAGVARAQERAKRLAEENTFKRDPWKKLSTDEDLARENTFTRDRDEGERLPWARTPAQARQTAKAHIAKFGMHKATVDTSDLSDADKAAAQRTFERNAKRRARRAARKRRGVGDLDSGFL